MSEMSPDEKRAKQLEDARKRVEELKKKTKKKSKKGKKAEDDNGSPQPTTGDETTPAPIKDDSPESVDPVPAETKEADKTDHTDSEGKPTSEEPEESNTSEVAKDQSGDASASEQQNAHDLFEDDKNPDFLATIQKQKEDDELQVVKNRLESVTADLKKLKFINMDQETTIDNLNQQVCTLQKELEEAKQEVQKSRQLTSTPPPLQFSTFTSSPQQRQHDKELEEQKQYRILHADRSTLDKWRNWNVDMTTWRSIGSGPIVEF